MVIYNGHFLFVSGSLAQGSAVESMSWIFVQGTPDTLHYRNL